MKNLIVILILIHITSLSYSQRRSNVLWFDMALKAGIGNSLFINENILTDNNIKTHYLTPSYSIGGKLGISVTEITNISVEAYKGSFGQTYDLQDAGIRNDLYYTKDIAFETLELAIMFRAAFYTGFYIEAGPLFTQIDGYSVTNSISENFTDLKQEDYAERFSSIAAGLGIAVIRSPDDRVHLNIGLRAHYSFDEFLKDKNKIPVKDGIYNANEHYFQNYLETTKTSPVTVKIMFELDYFFGFYGRARCGRTKFVLFKHR